MMRWMCRADRRPLIWKAKANELFALTAADLARTRYETVMGLYWRREVHLLFRGDVLKLAMEKHGGAFDALNAAFLARKQRNAKRKRRQPRLSDDW